MMMAEMPLPALRKTSVLGEFDDFLGDFLAKGGPLPPEYATLNRAIRHLGDAMRSGQVTAEQVQTHMQIVTRRHLRGTMQAEAMEQQFGYSGDFQIIDHIYTRHTNPDPHLRCWDLYFHAQAAPVAVRNRKAYFQELMQRQLAERRGGVTLEVLNVASGPARDVREFFQNHPQAPVVMDCVEMDARAIAHAKALCAPWLDRLTFHQGNVLRHVPTRGGYDLAWSAGLFDYLSDRLFVHLLKAMIAVTKPGGEVVVGNFSDYNPSRDYMELMGHWQLRHRSRETLTVLAAQAGVSPDQMELLWEPEGVNYFLHIRR